MVGHEIGDHILIKVAKRIGNSLQSIDHISRLSGDEFAVILTGISDKEKVEWIVKEILRSIGSTMTVEGQQYSLSCSIGIANYPENAKRIDETHSKMNIAISSVKNRGGEDMHFIGPT